MSPYSFFNALVIGSLLVGCSGSKSEATGPVPPAPALSEPVPKSPTPPLSAFEQDPEATSLAICSHAATASGNKELEIDMMASLRMRHEVMYPTATSDSRTTDIEKVIATGKTELESKGIVKQEDLAPWIQANCF